MGCNVRNDLDLGPVCPFSLGAFPEQPVESGRDGFARRFAIQKGANFLESIRLRLQQFSDAFGILDATR